MLQLLFEILCVSLGYILIYKPCILVWRQKWCKNSTSVPSLRWVLTLKSHLESHTDMNVIVLCLYILIQTNHKWTSTEKTLWYKENKGYIMHANDLYSENQDVSKPYLGLYLTENIVQVMSAWEDVARSPKCIFSPVFTSKTPHVFLCEAINRLNKEWTSCLSISRDCWFRSWFIGSVWMNP